MSEITENPRGGCVLSGIRAVLCAIDRVCPIYHSGPGCAFQSSAATEGHGGKCEALFYPARAIPTTAMLEKEVVFGGTKKLRTTIQGAISLFDADAYFVLTGCTAGINGDDIESVVKEFQHIQPVYAIKTAGFEGNDMLGYEVVFDTFIDQIIEKKERQANLVNLLGIVPYHDPYWSGTIEEITRILNKLGLEVNNFFTAGQGIESVRNAGNAAANIIVHPWLLRGAEKRFEEKFGIPSIRVEGMPVGPTASSDFVRQVGTSLFLDKELVEKVIAEEEEYVYRYYEQAIGKLSWKRFAVVGDSNYGIGLTRFLANDYGFSPVLTVISEPVFRPKDKEVIERRLHDLEYAKTPKILFKSDQFDISNAISQAEDLSLLVGSSSEKEIAEEIGIQCIPVTFPVPDRVIFNRTYAGYKGSLTLVEDLYDNL